MRFMHSLVRRESVEMRDSEQNTTANAECEKKASKRPLKADTTRATAASGKAGARNSPDKSQEWDLTVQRVSASCPRWIRAIVAHRMRSGRVLTRSTSEAATGCNKPPRMSSSSLLIFCMRPCET